MTRDVVMLTEQGCHRVLDATPGLTFLVDRWTPSFSVECARIAHVLDYRFTPVQVWSLGPGQYSLLAEDADMSRKQALEYHSQVKPPAPFTMREALTVLAESDHGYLTEGYASAICVAFGVPTFIQKVVSDDRVPKGLTAYDDDGNQLANGTVVFGADAAALAEHICVTKGVAFLPQFGRGSQLRACVRALEGWLGSLPDDGGHTRENPVKGRQEPFRIPRSPV